MGNEPRNPLVMLAILKAVGKASADSARDAAAVGKYKISSLVRLDGTISVGEDTTATIPAELKPWDIIAILGSKVNEATLRAVCQEVILAYRSGEEIKGVEAVKAVVKAVVKDMKEETRDVRRGQVRYVGDVEIVEQNIALCL